MSQPIHQRSATASLTTFSFVDCLQQSLDRQAKALLEVDDLNAAMEALSPLEAYFAIKELGLADAAPLLSATTPLQRQACIDLDCWVDDQWQPQELEVWLESFMQDDLERLAEVFLELDYELQVLFLKERLYVEDVEVADDSMAPTGSVLELVDGSSLLWQVTADGFFAVAPRGDIDSDSFDIMLLLKALDQHYMMDTVRLLTSVRWELEAELLEDAYRFRCGRMADLGFPDRQRAMQLLMPPAKTQPLQPAEKIETAITLQQMPKQYIPAFEGFLPAIYAQAFQEGQLFHQTMLQLSDPDVLQRLQEELIFLINAAMVAYRESPRDLQHVAGISAYVRNGLSLGLDVYRRQFFSEMPNQKIASLLAPVVAKQGLQWLFQLGQQFLWPLHAAAQNLHQDPIVTAWCQLVLNSDEDEQAMDRIFLRHLLSWPILWFKSDHLQSSRGKALAFASCFEVEAASKYLETLSQRLV